MHGFEMKLARITIVGAAIVAGACSRSSDKAAAADSTAQGAVASRQSCAGDNGGLTLPPNFCATIFADSLGHVRHLAVASNGDVYANTWSGKYYADGTTPPHPFLVALRD